MPTKIPNVYQVSTTDFFYPLVEDPYLQGRIACANVLSDLYSMGIYDCDSNLMILAASDQMTDSDRKICTRLMIEGYTACSREAGIDVTGGQTVINPWPIIGGVAMAVCTMEDIIMPENAEEGDVLVLTKPIGTQLAVNAFQWMNQNNANAAKVKQKLTDEQVTQAFAAAQNSMVRLSRTAAKLMHKHHARASTDVTGFGILGHTTNLAENSKAAVDMELTALPIIKNMALIDEMFSFFHLLEGKSAETSGGLLIAFKPADAIAFCKDIEEEEGYPAWQVGRVVKRKGKANTARIVENVRVIEV